MEELERRVLEKHREELVADMAEVEPILDHLISTAVLRANDDNVQWIRSGHTALMRARKLLDILPSRDSSAFGHFVDALRSVRPHLSELLMLSLEELKTRSPDPCRLRRPPRPAHPLARKLQEALCEFHQNKADRLPLFDFQPHAAQAAGLDEVFVTLSAIDFHDAQTTYERQKSLSAKQLRRLASKSWCERLDSNAVEITDVSRLLRCPSGRVARSSLLLARAAGGKTLTLLKMAALWAEGGDDVLSQFEFVFYVSARDGDALSGKTAIDVLRLDEFDFTARQQEEITEYLSDNSDKVLVLLDGADEGGEKWTKSKGLAKILQRKGGLRKCSFVVTSRPCEAAYHLMSVCDLHFHVLGFSQQRLEELLRRRLGEAEGQKLAEVLKQARWSQLQALMAETPLVANMVASLAANGLSLPQTLTELYTVVVVNMTRRSSAKTRLSRIIAGNLDELPAVVKASLTNVGKLALNGLKHGRFVFNIEQEVQPVCGDMAELFGLLVEFHTVSLRGERHEAHFCHLTYQEFLAAFCVSQSENVEQELDSCRCEIGFGEETWTFWRFIGGLLGRRKIETLMSFLIKSKRREDILYTKKGNIFAMSCFAEAMEQWLGESEDATVPEIENTGIRKKGEVCFLPYTLDLSSQAMSYSDMHAVSVSLAHNDRTAELNIAFCDINNKQLSILSAHGGLQHISRLNLQGNPHIHGDGLVTLASVLCQTKQLRELEMEECGLDEDDCAALSSLIIANKCLILLRIAENIFTTSALENLRPALVASVIVFLDLSDTSMNTEGAHVLGEVLAQSDHLQDVDLSRNDLGDAGAEAVLRGALAVKKTSQVQERSLNFVSTNLSDAVATSLSALLHAETSRSSEATQQTEDETPTALHLLLHGNNITEAALQHLASGLPPGSMHSIECGMHAIRNGTLSQRDLSVHFARFRPGTSYSELQLSQIGIDCEGARQVARHLENDHCPIEALDLVLNTVGDEGANVLAQALSSNSLLRGLSLGYNGLCRPGCLFSVLAQANRSLQWLELCGNPIFNEQKSQFVAESRECLSALVTKSPSLKYLGLGMTGFGDDECRTLQAALSAKSSSLHFISLGRNRITAAGAAALAQGLEQNTTVCRLNLANNRIGDEGAAALGRCAQARKDEGVPLRCVWMAGNGCDPGRFSDCMVNRAFFYSSILVAMDINIADD